MELLELERRFATRDGTEYCAFEVGILVHITAVAVSLVIVFNCDGDLPYIVHSIRTGDFLYLDFRGGAVDFQRYYACGR